MLITGYGRMGPKPTPQPHYNSFDSGAAEPAGLILGAYIDPFLSNPIAYSKHDHGREHLLIDIRKPLAVPSRSLVRSC